MSGITAESVRVDPRKVLERVACRAYLSADQSDLTSSSWNKINLGAVTYDLGSNYSTSTYKFTAPVSGLFQIIGQVSFTSGSVQDAKRYGVSVYKNGASICENQALAGVADAVSASVVDEVYLDQNDYLELYAYTTGTGNTVDVDGDTNGTLTFLVVRLITKEGIRQ